MKIRIVTHVYAVDLPQYAYFLDAQMWSIEQFAPRHTSLSICLCQEDELSIEAIKRHQSDSYEIRLYLMTKKDLFNRAVGRNVAALRQQDDIVWFTDVDHVFGEGCLQALAERMKKSNGVLHHPSSLKIHKDHATGDKCWQELRDQGRFYLDEDDFVEKVYRKAIGGVQIVHGDFARKHGYLNDNPSALKQTDGTKPFPSFKDDVKYRKFCESQGSTIRLALPNLYRLRHTETSYQ